MNIFRRIRKKLIDRNRLSKYLLYAIGEITLVVAGILIALAINTWKENKLNRAFEVKMLTEINDALREDYRFYSEHLIGFRNKTELRAVAYFDNLILSDSGNRDSIDYYFNSLDFGLQPTVNRGPYDALKASGIDRISNAELRNKLVYFYDFILPRYEGLIEHALQSSRATMTPLIKELSEPVPITISNGEVIRPGMRLKDIDLTNDQRFNQLLYETKDRATKIRFFLDSTTPVMVELIEILENEI